MEKVNTYYLHKEAEVGRNPAVLYTQALTLAAAETAVENIDRQEETYTIQERDYL